MDLKKYKDFETSMERLEEAYKKASENKNGELYSFFRDSTIQRFEFTVEIFWFSRPNSDLGNRFA